MHTWRAYARVYEKLCKEFYSFLRWISVDVVGLERKLNMQIEAEILEITLNRILREEDCELGSNL